MERSPCSDWSYTAGFILGRNHDGLTVFWTVIVPLAAITSPVFLDPVEEEVGRIRDLLKTERAKMACPEE
jgi:hypothetical protein